MFYMSGGGFAWSTQLRLRVLLLFSGIRSDIGHLMLVAVYSRPEEVKHET